MNFPSANPFRALAESLRAHCASIINVASALDRVAAEIELLPARPAGGVGPLPTNSSLTAPVRAAQAAAAPAASSEACAAPPLAGRTKEVLKMLAVGVEPSGKGIGGPIATLTRQGLARWNSVRPGRNRIVITEAGVEVARRLGLVGRHDAPVPAQAAKPHPIAISEPAPPEAQADPAAPAVSARPDKPRFAVGLVKRANAKPTEVAAPFKIEAPPLKAGPLPPPPPMHMGKRRDRSEEEAIAKFIAERGVTKAPSKFAAASDQAAIPDAVAAERLKSVKLPEAGAGFGYGRNAKARAAAR